MLDFHPGPGEGLVPQKAVGDRKRCFLITYLKLCFPNTIYIVRMDIDLQRKNYKGKHHFSIIWIKIKFPQNREEL